ncbi:hypothetical protein G6671_09275 [Polynucleobacter paneuropaeus]|nr:hypothetical protein [Polynucleobacter paneuropaeus]QWD38880.1 hypothetical protein G6671_09275 [Polynucleobacter paneuropaeus]
MMKPIGVGMSAKIGAILLLLWGILHIWVGAEGIHQYLAGDVQTQWKMLLGGVNGSKEAFQFVSDEMTGNVHSRLLINFCLDVGGYGVLAIFLAWMIWGQGSWLAYWITVLVIGIADLAFLFNMLLSGIIEPNIGTIGGPVLWFIVVLITPFGLPKGNKLVLR